MKGPSGKEPQQRVNSYETRTFVKSGKHPVNQIQELNGCLLKGLTFIFKAGRFFICIHSFDKNKYLKILII